MRSAGLEHRDVTDSGARARAALERWLNAALRLPDGRLPRIPVRRVASGGFDRLASTDRGRRVTEQWWARTLENDALDNYDRRANPRRAAR